MPESVAQATLKVQVTGVNQGSNAVKGFQQTVTRSMTASEKSVASAIGGMIAQYAGMAVAIRQATKVMSSGIEFNKFVENQTMAFTVMMKSASAAKKQMEDLYNFAVNSPLTFKESAGSAKQLMAYGFAAKELVPTMKMLGSVAIATGNSLSDISYVYGTLRSQGRAYSRDLMQFGMRGIPIYEELAKVMGVSADKIQKLASQGKIGFKEVEKAFRNMTSEGGKFSGILEGYMATLTGKLSMLSDIAEQTAGTLMKPVTNIITDTVGEITKQFQSSSFQKYIKDLGKDLGSVASALSKLLLLVIDMLPVLTAFVKLWITFKALKLVTEIFGKIPKLLFIMGDAFVTGGIALNTFTASGATMGAVLSASFASATTGLRLFMAELSTFIIANPWILALVGVAAATGAAISTLSKVHERNKTSENPEVRARELSKEYGVRSYNATFGDNVSVLEVEDVKKIAEEYRLTEGVTAKILMNLGALSKESWQQYINQKASVKGLEDYAKIQEGLLHTTKTMEQEQMDFLSGLTGLPASVYEDLSNVDLNALGNQGAKDYIAGFAQQRKAEKDIFGLAYTSDMLKSSLQAESEGIEKALRDGSKVDGLFNTQYNETLNARLMQINKELDGLGKKSKKLASLNKWWLPQEADVAATTTAIDDAQLAMEKALYNANAEADARQKIIQAHIDEANAMDNSIEKTAILTQWSAELLRLDQERAQVNKDITKFQEKQVGLSKYNEAVEGAAGYWDGLKAMAGDAYAAAKEAFKSGNTKQGLQNTATAAGTHVASGIRGTELGGVVSGGNPIAMAVQAIVEFALSIGSVQKVLNPFKTILEQARNVLEPLVDGILEPMTNVLEMSGDLLGQLLRPIMAIMKLLNVFTYILETWVFVPLQMLGGALAWLYDEVIVVIGNKFINIVNAIIRVLNKLPWVNIKYIKTLKKTTDQVEDFGDAVSNIQNSLDETISYLENKLKEIYDTQLESVQDLYEVGAITASQYESQVADLNAMMPDQDPLVSLADEQLATQEGILQRLAELYSIKASIDAGGMSDAEILEALTSAGLTAENISSIMAQSISEILDRLKPGKVGGYSAPITTPTTVTEDPRPKAQAALDSYVQLFTVKTSKDSFLQGSSTSTIEGYLKLLQYKAYKDAVSDLLSTYDINKIASDPSGFSAAAQGIVTKYGQYTSSFAVGTPNVPYDMTAQLHKGEIVTPATFSEGIRKGDLILSSNKAQGSEPSVTVNVTVQGSVTSENNLATSISKIIYQQRSRGILTT